MNLPSYYKLDPSHITEFHPLTEKYLAEDWVRHVGDDHATRLLLRPAKSYDGESHFDVRDGVWFGGKTYGMGIKPVQSLTTRGKAMGARGRFLIAWNGGVIAADSMSADVVRNSLLAVKDMQTSCRAFSSLAVNRGKGKGLRSLVPRRTLILGYPRLSIGPFSDSMSTGQLPVQISETCMMEQAVTRSGWQVRYRPSTGEALAEFRSPAGDTEYPLFRADRVLAGAMAGALKLMWLASQQEMDRGKALALHQAWHEWAYASDTGELSPDYLLAIASSRSGLAADAQAALRRLRRAMVLFGGPALTSGEQMFAGI